jgi:thiamine biosynthesis lipoprotein
MESCRASLMLICAVLSVLVPLIPEGIAAEPQLSRFQRTQIHMGMSFGIVLYASDESAANRAFTAAFARIEALNGIFSDYDTDSEVSRLCDLAPTKQPVPVSIELATVLAHAQHLSRQSDGAFDVTVGPLTKLWRRARGTKRPPDPERLQTALQSVGFRNLIVDSQRRTVELTRSKMRIDLGAIVPGYAADEAIRIMAELGISHALVNASGDVTVADPPPGELGWKIDIAPLEPKGKPSRSVFVRNSAVSTSGDAFQFIEFNGQRYSHIIDPKTGYGLTNRSSVTVIAKTGMEADGLATTASVLGPEKGMKLIESIPDTAAFIVTVEGNSTKTFCSRTFEAVSKPVSADIP